MTIDTSSQASSSSPPPPITSTSCSPYSMTSSSSTPAIVHAPSPLPSKSEWPSNDTVINSPPPVRDPPPVDPPITRSSSPNYQLLEYHMQQLRQLEQIESPKPWIWILWRLVVAFQTLCLFAMIVWAIIALVHDKHEPCDASIYQWNIGHVVLLWLQLFISITMLIYLPSGSKWTWLNHKRGDILPYIYIVSGVIVLGQAIMIPIGFAFIRNATSCIMKPMLIFEVTYYLVIIQCVLFVIFGVPAFFLPCIFYLGEFLPTRFEGIPLPVLDRMPTIIYRHECPSSTFDIVYNRLFTPRHQATIEADICGICIKDWKRGDRIKKLPCGHGFHEKCIKTWLSEKTFCPACRRVIYTPR